MGASSTHLSKKRLPRKPAATLPRKPPRQALERGRADAEQLYAAEIRRHALLTAEEEIVLAKRLESLEITIWKLLLKGPLAFAARKQLLELEPPIKPSSAKAARAADLDRHLANRVIAEAASSDRHAEELRALRPLLVEADRIRERFVTSNLRLVIATIRRHGYHFKTRLSMSDLIQEGNFGLLKAVARFDHRRGLKFNTFATWWIRHYVVRARQNLGADVRVPVHLQELSFRSRSAKTVLVAELGRDPTQDELAARLKVSKKSIQSLESDWLRHAEALPAFDSVGEDGELPSTLASTEPRTDEVLIRRQEHERIELALGLMPAQLSQVIRRRFGLGDAEPEVLIEIGTDMSLSRERIRQLEKKALTYLRQLLGSRLDLHDVTLS